MDRLSDAFWVITGHQYQMPLFLCVVLLGVVMFSSKRLLKRAEVTASPGTLRVCRAARIVSFTLFWLSLIPGGASFFHVGCARTVRQEAKCSGKMRYLWIAMRMYMADYDDRYPLAAQWNSALHQVVPAKAFNYLGSSAEQCQFGLRSSFYGLNSHLSGRLVDEIKDPSALVCLFESASRAPNFSGGIGDVVNRHRGGSNVAFADGHVTFIKTIGFQTLVWSVPKSGVKK